ncbi:MAG: GTPase HflX [Firmicutes bacterium]|nr:GTPase HflX [Bacillota bacterium]
MYKVKKERVLLVGVDLKNKKKDRIDIKSSMGELKKLAEAAGGLVIENIIQNKEKINPACYIGKGKAEEIARYCEELNIDLIVFNDELSGTQLRNLEDIIGKRVIDRTAIILDIFAKRATTKEGKLQVELAQLKYRLPRLVGLGTELSRTGAGIGTRGPGEKKLEIDRRHISSRINEVKNQLKNIENIRKTKRTKRLNSRIPIVALVGYTNAGKSTLLNTIIKNNDDYKKEREVFTYDMLFATLETNLRKATLPNGQSILITDTVGFVNKLPTHLIEAFKGTLEEVVYADLLLHVVDITNENLDIQFDTTLKILRELGVDRKPTITVFNKIDRKRSTEINYNIKGPKSFISAKEKMNTNELLKLIEDSLPRQYYDVKLLIPFSESDIVSYLFDSTKVKEFKHTQKGTFIETTVNEIDYEKYKGYITE